MMRLIDADALKELICSNVYPVADVFNSRDYGMFWTGGIEKAIDEMPTISSAERRGKWTQLHYKMFRCSECKKANEHYTAFCPNCGARMEGDNG